MASLRAAALLAAALALGAAGPAHADPVDRWRPYVAEASARFGVPIPWIEQVIRAESGGLTMRDGHPIRSHAGAIGLMQLMPQTWGEMRGRLGLGGDPDDPRSNILAGTLYLRLMADRFGYPGLFAAYNAGPQRYAEHLAKGRRLPAETLAYLTMVTGAGGSDAPAGNREPLAKSPQHRLFFPLSSGASGAGRDLTDRSLDALFVDLPSR